VFPGDTICCKAANDPFGALSTPCDDSAYAVSVGKKVLCAARA